MGTRRWLRVLILLLVAAAVGAGIWFSRQRRRLATQWESYQVGQAETFREAARLIGELEQTSDPTPRLRELTARWGTGNQLFDFYLACYVRSAESSERLRETFSLEMAWRPVLLPRWAHFWIWQSPGDPDDQIASVVEYLDVLVRAEPPRELTWREVLNLQAVLQLAGAGKLAERLKPDNWRGRYLAWQPSRPSRLPHVARPDRPLPDWQGPLPAGDQTARARLQGRCRSCLGCLARPATATGFRCPKRGIPWPSPQ